MHYEKCHKCKGTGDYFHPQAKRVTGKCHMCGGTGKFYPIRKGPRTFFGMSWGKYKELPDNKRIPVESCKKCDGRGETPIPSGKFFYNKCTRCDGIGEIKIYNPVLPRGYLRS
jgi:DnaJ-class molecular chaperone